jgi:23S rRNA (uracil1939-C5)-methyltransferase
MMRNRCVLEAEALDVHGFGVGHSSGLDLRVADLLPGERAEIEVEHRSPHGARAWGHVLRRLGDPPPERVAPACPRFGQCGGCTWQHLSYPAQLRHKRQRVDASLAALAPPGVTVEPVVPSPQVVGYRNKGKYVVGRVAGRLTLGAFLPRTHQLIDTLGCKVVAPVIDEVATWARGAAEAAGLAAYDEGSQRGELRYVIVRSNADEEVLVGIVVTSTASRDRVTRLGEALSRHPSVRGVLAIDNDRRDGGIVPAGSGQRVVSGSATIGERLAGVELQVGIGEFLQVNRAAAAGLHQHVAAIASASEGLRVTELFAGLGGISLILARAGAVVHAVEIDREAVASLAAACVASGLDRVTAIAGDVGAVPLPASEVVVVNPPRKGLPTPTLKMLAAARVPTLIYVSCGPESLHRDLAALTQGGYVIDKITPFDLMPGTGHIETVVRLRMT